jgi:hypothetical protein
MSEIKSVFIVECYIEGDYEYLDGVKHYIESIWINETKANARAKIVNGSVKEYPVRNE